MFHLKFQIPPLLARASLMKAAYCLLLVKAWLASFRLAMTYVAQEPPTDSSTCSIIENGSTQLWSRLGNEMKIKIESKLSIKVET